MRDEHVINAQQLFELQVANTGSRVDKDVVINQKGRCTLVASANSATAAQNPHLHLDLMEFRNSGIRVIHPGAGK